MVSSDIDDDGILTSEEPYTDSNENGQWDLSFTVKTILIKIKNHVKM